MTAATRQYDSPGRYGGEEFLIVLPGCDARAGRAQAERIREAFACQPFDIGGEPLTITCSIGVSSRDACATGDANRLIHEADEALYAAKRDGRNRVVPFTPEEPVEDASTLEKLASLSRA
jgi:diguanylate cyclase (GGDEF)-like protein